MFSARVVLIAFQVDAFICALKRLKGAAIIQTTVGGDGCDHIYLKGQYLPKGRLPEHTLNRSSATSSINSLVWFTQ